MTPASGCHAHNADSASARPRTFRGGSLDPDLYAGLPSDAEIIRQGGTAGFAIAKNLNAGREAYYKQQQEKIKLHQAALTGLASLAAGAHDEPSKVEAIAAAFNNGWIDGPTRDQLYEPPLQQEGVGRLRG